MYSVLLVIHSVFRWIALAVLVYSICRALAGYRSNKPFTVTDNSIRHWTATILQVQLVVGLILYFNSPFVQTGDSFFTMAHPLSMFVAVLVASAGSAIARRKQADREKFRTMIIGCSLCLLIILIAIPWPFSPLAQRPYIRSL